MMLLFSAPDCAGKDTLMHALAKEFNYKYFMCPRSPICNMVYDSLYQRNFDSLRLVSGFLKLGAYFILIKVQPEELLRRALKRNEKHVSHLDAFKLHSTTYNKFFRLTKKEFPLYQSRFIVVDNTGDLQIPVNIIKRRINRDLRQSNKILMGHVKDRIRKLQKAIKNK